MLDKPKRIGLLNNSDKLIIQIVRNTDNCNCLPTKVIILIFSNPVHIAGKLFKRFNLPLFKEVLVPISVLKVVIRGFATIPKSCLCGA
jgi:hypothetical protein